MQSGRRRAVAVGEKQGLGDSCAPDESLQVGELLRVRALQSPLLDRHTGRVSPRASPPIEGGGRLIVSPQRIESNGHARALAVEGIALVGAVHRQRGDGAFEFDLDQGHAGHLGGSRTAPSRRITVPFRYAFSTMSPTSRPNSAGSPSRAGNGMFR